MSNFFHQQVGNCLVAVSGPGPLSASDFDTFVSALDRAEITRYLSYSTGTTEVSRSQQKKTSEILRRRKTRVALVNESKVTMGLVAAARFLGLMDMRVFEHAQTRQAVLFLEPADAEGVLAALSECKNSLSHSA